jgi:hypothetical protein
VCVCVCTFVGGRDGNNPRYLRAYKLSLAVPEIKVLA